MSHYSSYVPSSQLAVSITKNQSASAKNRVPNPNYDRKEEKDNKGGHRGQVPQPVKHSDDFKIVVILDESGSMEAIRKDMIKALNDLIKEQKQLDRPCKFTFIKFNDKVKKVIENTDLKEVREFSLEDYCPDRSTALYDAIGSTVDWFRYETNVLLVIITDGLENASTKYNKKRIFDLLDEKKKYRNWTYVYLSNDLTNSAQGTHIGCDNSAYSANCVTGINKFGSYLSQNMNKAIYNYRATGQSVQSQLI
jgi:hypothetical protein